MIVPLSASTIARTTPAARVRRRSSLRNSAATTAEADADADAGGASRDPVAVLALSDAPAASRQAMARPSAAFLASLLTLRRGG